MLRGRPPPRQSLHASSNFEPCRFARGPEDYDGVTRGGDPMSAEFNSDAFRSETRDGMRIDWDVPITMEDGVVLRCDVYRPIKDGKYPVIITYGPYAKWLHFEQIYKTCWDKMVAEHPEVPAGSSNRYQNWEV